MIGQQPFEVVFHQRVEHTQHRRNGANGQDRHAPPQRRRAKKLKTDACQPEDARLDEDPGHQRRDVAGRDRMGRRQPDMERDDAGLDPKTEQEKNKGGISFAGRHHRADVVQAAEAVIARRLKEQQKTQHETPGINVRHDEEEHARLACLRLFMFKADKAECGQRHQFPGDEEDPNVVRHEDQGRGQEHCVVESAQHADILASEIALGVADRVDRNRHRKQRNDDQEKRAQRVEADGEPEAGHKRADAGDQRGQQFKRPVRVRRRAGQKQEAAQQAAQPGDGRQTEGECRRQSFAAHEQQASHSRNGISAERREK